MLAPSDLQATPSPAWEGACMPAATLPRYSIDVGSPLASLGRTCVCIVAFKKGVGGILLDLVPVSSLPLAITSQYHHLNHLIRLR